MYRANIANFRRNIQITYKNWYTDIMPNLVTGLRLTENGIASGVYKLKKQYHEILHDFFLIRSLNMYFFAVGCGFIFKLCLVCQKSN